MSLIVKIVGRSGDPGGLINYLANDKNLHENQRIVAGTVRYQGHLDKELAQQVAADLRFYQQITGKVMPKGHVYHVTLSASRENGPIPDARWDDIANDFMDGMRFTGPNLSPVRWTAVNHGANASGADHIHIAMSLVRQNGRQVNLYNDMVRASGVATRLEQKYGLGVLQTRLALIGAGSVPYTHGEIKRAEQEGRPEADRVRLERDIRALAGQARSEVEFIKLVKDDGLLIAPFPREKGLVKGYSVALPTSAGTRQDWLAGGKLAKDLTLPQLRRRWPGTPNQRVAAQHAWRGSEAGQDQERQADGGTEVTPDDLAEALQQATPAAFADLSHDLAANLAAASRILEEVPGELAAASRDAGAWAQPHVLPEGAPLLTRAGARLFVQGLDPSGERGRSIMFRQFADTMLELYRLHQVQRLRVATRRQVGRMDDANPAAEVMDDGTTLAATGSMLAVMQTARNERTAIEHDTAADTGGDGEMFGKTKGQGEAKSGGLDLIDRDFFRDARRMEQAHRASVREQAKLIGIGPPATPDQIERLEKLSEQVGLPLDRETLAAVRQDRAADMILDFESAAKDYGLPPIQTGQYEAVVSKVVGPYGVSNGAEADAFLGGLERRAQLRQEAADLAAFDAAQAAAKNAEAPWIDPDHMVDTPPDVADMRAQLDHVMDCGPLLSDAQVVEQNRKMHAAGIHPVPVVNGTAQVSPPLPTEGAAYQYRAAPARSDAPIYSGDPRNWENAMDPISKPQRYRLQQAGFSDVEIGELAGKGEASVVVGAYLGPDTPPVPDPARARAAYDKVQAEAIGAVSGMGTPTQPRVADLPSQTATPTIAAPQQASRKPLRPTQ
jgi:hypothetical protein